MDFLKAEIARKKKQLEQSEVLNAEKKYFKRGDLAAKQAEQYWKKNKRMKTDNEQEVSSSQEKPNTSQDNSEEKPSLPRKEVIRRLRERGEPIILFGETELEAFKRLRKLEILEPEVNKGFQNDMKDAMDKVDQAYLNEIMKATGEGDSGKSVDVQVRDDGTTYEDIQKLAVDLGKGDDSLDQEVILKFMKLILKKWGEQLNSRPGEEKRSFKGKLASATHTQTVSYTKPLLRDLKGRTVTLDILECLVDIVRSMLDRHYLKANDAYLEMAIGNAPWPIGVTMVGIHARTGREKIFSRNVAHVLNDETQRKYIQGLKRLMTKCQEFFPTDPSRSVNYEATL